ncbi:hypothetical protein ILUMI_25058 [Ignelater luminosus]|uniref:Uncharacterized protein n=1 Tax=Ignelater luminosus TaxID=2038154 RepID=A0A8K0CCC7_IGNLU|nr:hypothetical protein ILUMI_25058 [Ignelater luminosus]
MESNEMEIASLKSPTGRLARWALVLRSYNNIKIGYVPGKFNVIADTLSCAIHTEEDDNLCSLCTVSLQMPHHGSKEIRETQLEDLDVTTIIECFEGCSRIPDLANWVDRGTYHVSDLTDYRQPQGGSIPEPVKLYRKRGRPPKKVLLHGSGTDSYGESVTYENEPSNATKDLPPEQDLFDIRNIEVLLEDENGATENADAGVLSEWEDEDELVLSKVRKQIIKGNPVWSKTANNYITPQPFTHHFGPNTAETPADIFYAYLRNMYLKRMHSKLIFLLPNGNAFISTSAVEMKFFVAISILMGIIVKPSYKSSKLELRDSFISTLVSKDKFSWLLGNNHIKNDVLQPNRGISGIDKLSSTKYVYYWKF